MRVAWSLFYTDVKRWLCTIFVLTDRRSNKGIVSVFTLESDTTSLHYKYQRCGKGRSITEVDRSFDHNISLFYFVSLVSQQQAMLR